MSEAGQARASQNVRRAAGRALVGGLSVAALTASVALVTGDLDDTDARVIGTSVMFAVCSAVAAGGAALRVRGGVNEGVLGGICVIASAVTFVLFTAGIWSDFDEDWPWRVFGCAAIVALATSHASVVLGARRATDSPSVQSLAAASLVLGGLDAFFGGLAVSGIVDEVDEGLAELFGVLLIALVLTTALPPILRRVQEPGTRGSTEAPRRIRGVSDEVLAIADRIETLNADPGRRSPEIRRECERLRAAARDLTP